MSVDWRDFSKRALVSILGIIVQAFGSSLSLVMNMGLDPYKAMNYGIAGQFGMSYGNLQLIVNILIFVTVLLIGSREEFGWGTIFNIVILGYAVDFFNAFFTNNFDVANVSFSMRILWTIIAIVIFSLGVAMYSEPDLGVSPYDAVAPIIVDRANVSYSAARVGQDIVVIIIALLLGGPVGISTIILGFFTGPLVDWFSDHITNPLLESMDVQAEGMT
jgi:uncharacterized membrane protein YczE